MANSVASRGMTAPLTRHLIDMLAGGTFEMANDSA
jgi:hypothetical protein